MSKFLFFTNIFLILISTNLYANKISVIDIDYLVDNNKYFNEIIEKIKINQSEYKKRLQLEEEKLTLQLEKIESSKIILNDEEINLLIDKYNINLLDFEEKVNEFNLHYQNEILKIRNIIIKEIIKIIENYAANNNIDLILNSTNYLIATNNINITDNIEKILNESKFELNFKSFEKN